MKGLVFGRFLGVAALVGVVGLVGCADETSATEGSDEAAEGVAQAPIVDQAAPEAVGAEKAKKAARKDRARERGDRAERGDHEGRGHRGGTHGPGHGGPEQLFHAALEELDLNGAQKAAIEGALADLEASRPERPEPGARGEGPFAAIADQVRQGSVDAAAVEAAFAEHRPDRTEHHAAVSKALGTLHSTLTGAQRRELVDAVTTRMDEREKAFAGKKGKRGAQDDAEGGPRGEGRGKQGGGPLKHLVGDLDLRDDQQAKVDAILAGLAPSDADRKAFEEKHATMKKEMRARLESFASDRFDAAAALPPNDAMKPDHHAKMAQALAAIVPVLDQAQRDALADRLEQGPMGQRGRHGGKGGRGMRGGAR